MEFKHRGYEDGLLVRLYRDHEALGWFMGDLMFIFDLHWGKK